MELGRRVLDIIVAEGKRCLHSLSCDTVFTHILHYRYACFVGAAFSRNQPTVTTAPTAAKCTAAAPNHAAAPFATADAVRYNTARPNEVTVSADYCVC